MINIFLETAAFIGTIMLPILAVLLYALIIEQLSEVAKRFFK